MSAAERLTALLEREIVLLDGSWGVLIQRDVRGEEAYRGERFRDHPRDVAGNPDLLNLTSPQVVRDIHRAYFAAGARIATTNTFTATSIGQADYGLEPWVAEMNVAGARLARAGSRRGWTGSSPAPSARSTSRCRCPRRSKILRFAPSRSTRSALPTPSRWPLSSKEASTC